MRFTGSVLLAGETHPEARINLARTNLKMEGQDLILVADRGYVSELETLHAANMIMDTEYDGINEAKDALVAFKNAEVT